MIEAARNLLKKSPQAEWLLPTAFCLILLGQLLFSVQQMSQHADESTHLYAGYRALKCGDYTFGREHPPLAKLLAATPLLASGTPIDCTWSNVGNEEADEAIHWLYGGKEWWYELTLARLVASSFSIALCIGVWVTSRRMFGLAAAILSTAVLVFEPTLLAHGALVLNDVLLTALLLFSVFSFYIWTRKRSAQWLVLTGFVCGLALLTKHSAVVILPTLFLLSIGEAWFRDDKATAARRALHNVGALLGIFMIAGATIWCGYGMQHKVEIRRATDGLSQGQLAGPQPVSVQVLNAVRTAHLLPQPYLDGLIEMRLMVGGSAGEFILGKYCSEAPWFFFPLTATVKCTLPFLLLLLTGGVGLITLGRERRVELLFLLLPALLYIYATFQVKRISGIRHLLPLLPLLLIPAAAGCVSLARRYRLVPPALTALVVLHAVSSIHAYPNYLSYANEAWGGPHNLYKHLPWTDSGQGYWEVRRYMEQHPNTPCWVDSDFYVQAASYKVPCKQMGRVFYADDIPERMNGIVFVSSTVLQLQGKPGGALAPFFSSKPKAQLGGSAMLVYEGEFDTSALASRVLAARALFLIKHNTRMGEALYLSKRAAELAKASPFAHEVYCIALADHSLPIEAIRECSISRNLALADQQELMISQETTRLIIEISQGFGLPIPPMGKS